MASKSELLDKSNRLQTAIDQDSKQLSDVENFCKQGAETIRQTEQTLVDLRDKNMRAYAEIDNIKRRQKKQNGELQLIETEIAKLK